MIKSLRESKAHLSELVEQASQGEEIIITVRGKPKARLCPYSTSHDDDRETWAGELRALQARYTAKVRDSSGGILDDIREDRI